MEVTGIEPASTAYQAAAASRRTPAFPLLYRMIGKGRGMFVDRYRCRILCLPVPIPKEALT